MLWTITVILLVAWLVGLVSSYTLGGWIHILLILAVISLIFNLLAGRRSRRFPWHGGIQSAEKGSLP